ncbi:unnamed protein product [Cyprideis torosa]|uniref:Uncharacterized protein n=1 Tax=Cyprideis torosa TaxID=163714 RepID=A0A7R8WKQ9_9CRUS|nr:unnamed protein product [Cyprideis torosa]CAG0897181.1 unnamed protein product [Cyprideis torosa]
MERNFYVVPIVLLLSLSLLSPVNPHAATHRLAQHVEHRRNQDVEELSVQKPFPVSEIKSPPLARALPKALRGLGRNRKREDVALRLQLYNAARLAIAHEAAFKKQHVLHMNLPIDAPTRTNMAVVARLLPPPPSYRQPPPEASTSGSTSSTEGSTYTTEPTTAQSAASPASENTSSTTTVPYSQVPLSPSEGQRRYATSDGERKYSPEEEADENESDAWGRYGLEETESGRNGPVQGSGPGQGSGQRSGYAGQGSGYAGQGSGPGVPETGGQKAGSDSAIASGSQGGSSSRIGEVFQILLLILLPLSIIVVGILCIYAICRRLGPALYSRLAKPQTQDVAVKNKDLPDPNATKMYEADITQSMRAGLNLPFNLKQQEQPTAWDIMLQWVGKKGVKPRGEAELLYIHPKYRQKIETVPNE